MSDIPTAPATDARATRAREWIRVLTEFPDRISGSRYEHEAAERIGQWMRELGLSDVSLARAAGGPRPGLQLALHVGVSWLGMYTGGLLGLLLTLLAVISFRSEFGKRRWLLSRLLPAADSVNVIGKHGAANPQRRVILTAHIDTTEAGFMFSKAITDRFVGLNTRSSRPDALPQPPHAVPSFLLISAVVLTFAVWSDAWGLWMGLARLIVSTGLLLTTGLGLQWAFSRATPGANDNASAVASMLTATESLKDVLPDDTQLIVVGTGAEECGHGGMRAIVESNTAWPPESTYYVNFECTGGGQLHYILTEGMLGKVTYPATLIELARRIAVTGRFGDITPTHLLAGTDGNVPARLNYPSLSLISLEANGVPRNYHRAEDTVEGIDTAVVVRAADFGSAVAKAALGGATNPL